ncbi:hypothetical protein K440DRAFT_575630 [Wilcoxina mikolae CBS 423.85]|nr:hypothetical protein K440DRAFT_575630 [Wilcoxina mikolae CBS 423.85]
MGDEKTATDVENAPDKITATLFLEDTVEIQLDGGEPVVGVIAKTWHDLDEQDIWGEIEDTIPGAKASHTDLRSFIKTGQPPRSFYYFAPSAPQNVPVLVHASECKLLDRAFAFGDVVKRSLTSPQSGTVVSVETNVTLRQSFIDAFDPTRSGSPIENVPEAELRFVNEWNIGDFVIYKNCWMGVLDDVREEVTIKLVNGSVVVVNDPYDLEIPVSSTEDFLSLPVAESQSANIPSTFPTPTPTATTQSFGRRGAQANKPRTIIPPAQLSPGQTVVTTKGNLWKGRWVFGAYDDSLPPLGVVVEVKTESFEVNWLCQNMMITGRFIPVERPPIRIIWEEEQRNICKFKKSTGGSLDLKGRPYRVGELGGGGELQVGDRVRFTDLDAAVVKYKGAIRKIARSEILGYDVNTFVVVATNTIVRVLWQDMTETVNDAKSLVPYLNVDDHEVWPGEIVVIKPDTSGVSEPKGETGPSPSLWPRERLEGVWDAWTAATGAVPSPGEKPEFMTPEKVGVVQSVNPIDRVASVRWFVSPSVEVAGGFLVPGSVTGPLQPTSEDVSLYDAVAHQALGVRRGDFVLIAPERPQIDRQDSEPDASTSNSATNNSPETPTPSGAEIEAGQLGQLVDSVRGMVDGGLLSNLSAALGNHSHPQLHAVSRMLNQFPVLMNGPHPGPTHAPPRPQAPRPESDNADAFANLPPEWLGEVVDLGLDGLVTVRLGALDEPRDIRVPTERLHIIFNEDMDFGDEDEDDEDDYYDTDEDGTSMASDEDDDIEYVGMNEPEVIEEKIIYEGGQRLDNGGEEDWLTDDNGDDDDDDDDGSDDIPDPTDYAPVVSRATQTVEETHATTAPTSEPIPRTPPPIPDNVPAPEAIRLTPGAPPRFQVLYSEIPSDHAYKNQPATARTHSVARRISREHKILSSSLPEGIFVRTWESRLDLLRVLIVGPLNTPYELAPFVFDFHFSNSFPMHPPVGFFHSWTAGIGRVNPNLYEDGKICLSLLGTWHAEKRAEGWSAGGSSVLQLLVSLMGLVLVREPWYSMFSPSPRIPRCIV